MENQTQKRFYLDLKNLQIFEVEKSNNTNSNLNTNEKNLVEITYDNHKISEEQIQKIISSKKFIDYIKNLDTDILLIKSLKILNVYMFGKNVGFIGLELDCSLKSHLDKKLPGYVFIRGKSVGILVLINRKYMVLTKQFRIPVGKMMYEIPAGMLDESGDFIGVAAKELEEEIGVKIKKDELKYLTSIFPSAGGCDEEIVIYLNELNLQEEEIEIMKTKTFGEENSDEVITLKIEDFNYENVMKTKDAKLIAAAFAAVNEKGVSFFSNSSSTSTSKF
jgi:ADP-sugar diphosphatase